MDTPLPSSSLLPSPAPISRAAVWASRLFNVLLLGLCALLVALSYYSFTLHCESFGCIGVGLMWMLWAVFATVGWLVALVVRVWQRRRGLGTRASDLAFALMSLMGAGHVFYWLVNTVLR
ncbi:hypothetical protein [Acidovorax kalamii]|uniref:Transmembrane protein n=1 Tax=Acidovorax kalamii TaxID=2004485 RepID=A0A235EKX4_9BURK|nr:hypothetical protein [Acidovorax kalamii]OYD49403.1 hypothetical protein CBY09_14360 [Acidovorax kalamii]